MNLFVPYDDSDLSRFALREACLMMTSRDAIFVMAAVIVPMALDIDVPAGEVWKQTCGAEVHLAAARSYAEQIDFGVDLRCVRVQAHTRAGAIIGGATYYEADAIFFAQRVGMRSRLASFFGPIHTVLRHAPCDVHIVYTASASASLQRPSPRRSTVVRLAPPPVASDPSERAVRSEPRYSVQQHGGTTPYASE
ncbi:MAG: universal stress protein [Thermomicrobiales bacterium]